MTAISQLQLENAAADAVSLASVVNGGATDVVITRTGVSLRTLSGIGELPATLGVDISNELVKTNNYTVLTTDIGKEFAFTLALLAFGTVKTVTLPPTTTILGGLICLRQTSGSLAQLQVKQTIGEASSVVVGWPSNTLYLLPGELIVLRASASGWEILGGISRPIKGLFKRSHTAGDVALSSGVTTAITFDTNVYGTVGTQFGNGFFALNTGTGVIQVLRRGTYKIRALARITTAASPTSYQLSIVTGSMFTDIKTPIGGGTHLKTEGQFVAAWGDQFAITALSTGGAATVDTADAGFEPTVLVEEDAPW